MVVKIWAVYSWKSLFLVIFVTAMKKITIEGKYGSSDIFIGRSKESVFSLIPKESIIITDKNLAILYCDELKPFRVVIIEGGEKSKKLLSLGKVYSDLLENNLDRSGFVVGFGGGVVCDIAGFVASTFMRGVKFGFISTSVLSQVDASVGGKNGINLMGYKNLIGLFNQPKFVYCDINLLQTLPHIEYINGFAEVVKHAVIADAEAFEYLEKNTEKALAHDLEVMEKLIADSIDVKTKIVSVDEHESGLRRLLNFGHTIGHAVERNGRYTHGEAVSIGMSFALDLSFKFGFIQDDTRKRVKRLLERMNLPLKSSIPKKLIAEDIRMDKKRENNEISFVFLDSIGSAHTEKISIIELEKYIDDLC